jgi:hypothetical protein
MTYGLGEVAPAERPSLARTALGLAVLAGEKLGAQAPYHGGVATALGLLKQGSTAARRAADRFGSTSRRTAERAGHGVARLSGVAVPKALLGRARGRLADAERTGRATVAASREDAVLFLRAAVDNGVSWAQVQVVPKLVDGLVPHLVAEVVPRIIEGAIPEIRGRVLPVVIEDLTEDPRVRELVLEQSWGAVGEAAERLRTSTSTADDRVESAFHRLIGREPR